MSNSHALKVSNLPRVQFDRQPIASTSSIISKDKPRLTGNDHQSYSSVLVEGFVVQGMEQSNGPTSKEVCSARPTNQSDFNSSDEVSDDRDNVEQCRPVTQDTSHYIQPSSVQPSTTQSSSQDMSRCSHPSAVQPLTTQPFKMSADNRSAALPTHQSRAQTAVISANVSFFPFMRF